ncbi:nek8 [Symbiodinium pilosum]|uniref:Nek8 protein n=1 Tax=Symbiodinium pilosum TaxID=2952 RepID=A0A812QDK3_SYMPI|nr:nek8 [Symbiodinium pilosum]
MRKVIDDLTGNAAAFAMSCFTTSREEFERFLIGTKYYHTAARRRWNYLMPKPFFRYLSQANQLGKGSLFGVPTEVIAIAGKELYVDPAVHEQFKKFARKWLDIYAQSDEIINRLNSTRMATLQQRSSELKEQCIAGQEFVQDALCILDNPRTISGSGVSSSFMISNDPSRKCGISWIRWGCTGLGLQVERTRDRDFFRPEWPRTIGFCCVSVTVLSARHQLFILLLLFDILMIVYEAIAYRPWLMAVFIANEVCVVAILICFEQIDEIAQLQRQQQRYRERRERLAAKAQKARNDWTKVQRLFDLWNYRTQPFLRIMGKLHRTLEGLDRDACMPRMKDAEARRPSTIARDAQRLQWLQDTNERISDLDARLEGVDWASEDPLQHETRRRLGLLLQDAERSGDVLEWFRRRTTSDFAMCDG